MSPDVPAVAGVLTARQVLATAESIAAVQEPCGAIPWVVDGPADPWNHLEAAMALVVAGLDDAADRALAWSLATQRGDGSWPRRWLRGEVDDPGTESNMTAYLAVAVWHRWLARRDRRLVDRAWPAVRSALDWVCDHQLAFGGIAWARGWTPDGPGEVDSDALVAGSASIHQALRCGVALGDLLGDPQPEWELAGGRLAHALQAHRDRFADRSTFSMDWYYPVLGGAVSGRAGRGLLAGRWSDFVVPSLGARCVDTNPWVTGAETCELVLALDALGDVVRARGLYADMQHLRRDDGSYWTGYVYPDDANWPVEQSTYTAAAVVLAADALAGRAGGGTGASGLFRGDGFRPPFAAVGGGCGCGSADRLAGRSADPA